jgi:hypothetical protein
MGALSMEIRSVFTEPNGRVSVVCPNCGLTITNEALRRASPAKPIQIKCTCNRIFKAAFEKRKYYRKQVELYGSFIATSPIRDENDIIVTDLSLTGLAFETVGKHMLRINDVGTVRFTLNDVQRSIIIRNVILKSVRDNLVGAAFCDGRQEKALAFYLRP